MSTVLVQEVYEVVERIGTYGPHSPGSYTAFLQ